ncbi:hypothetical protein An15g05010 [Aspergillus niger]|uniref:Uncharacterized protein n=2 Tax=Aspergillus niger TaxID=5061 RepID=A2R5P0_ASPNC|nr:hypothetical protein An15g05010 [Aspergillus niger]CAK42476.1 hypothetical protein An15g05010 [Aspergillus niger]
MGTNEKATTSISHSSSSATPSRTVTVLRNIVQSPWTLPYIAMVTPLVRSIWNYMGWSNGGEVALSLSHGLLILYFIISQYVRSCTGKELQHLLCEILSRLSVLKISNTGFVETNTPRFTLIVIATCPRQVEWPKSTHPPPRWSCLGAFQGEMRERHLAGNSETAMFYYFAPHRVGLVGERAMVILKVSMRQCSHQL